MFLYISRCLRDLNRPKMIDSVAGSMFRHSSLERAEGGTADDIGEGMLIASLSSAFSASRCKCIAVIDRFTLP